MCWNVNLGDHVNDDDGGFYCWTLTSETQRIPNFNADDPVKVRVGISTNRLCERIADYNHAAFDGVELLVIMPLREPAAKLWPELKGLKGAGLSRKKRAIVQKIERAIFRDLVDHNHHKYVAATRIFASENFIISKNEAPASFFRVWMRFFDYLDRPRSLNAQVGVAELPKVGDLVTDEYGATGKIVNIVHDEIIGREDEGLITTWGVIYPYEAGEPVDCELNEILERRVQYLQDQITERTSRLSQRS